MTDQEINIAIAEACGWVWTYGHNSLYDKCSVLRYWRLPQMKPLEGVAYKDIPQFCTDLNAMHEAWLSLNLGEQCEFSDYLAEIVCRNQPNRLMYDLTLHGVIENATAHQRAEAFLRTIGKWTT